MFGRWRRQLEAAKGKTCFCEGEEESCDNIQADRQRDEKPPKLISNIQTLSSTCPLISVTSNLFCISVHSLPHFVFTQELQEVHSLGSQLQAGFLVV